MKISNHNAKKMQTLDCHLQYRSYHNRVLYYKFFEHAQEEEEERKARNSNERSGNQKS